MRVRAKEEERLVKTDEIFDVGHDAPLERTEEPDGFAGVGTARLRLFESHEHPVERTRPPQ
jgi:hypothetical protein